MFSRWTTAITISALLAASVFLPARAAEGVELASPGGTFEAKVFTGEDGRLSFSVDAAWGAVAEPSPMGVTVEGADYGAGVRITGHTMESIDETFPTRLNHTTGAHRCNEATIAAESAAAGAFRVEFRACDDGAAFRYIVPGAGTRKVTGEATAWRMPAGATAWFQTNLANYEDEYRSATPPDPGTQMGPPVTFELPGGGFAAITESDVTGYSGMTLISDDGGVYRAEFLDDPDGWPMEGDIETPWRVLMVSEDLNGLVNSDLVEALAPPPAEGLAGAEWIRPGRCLWSWLNGGRAVVTPENMRKYVDDAKELSFEYVLVDDGWEDAPPHWRGVRPGWWEQGKTQIEIMAGLVDYAREHGVDIWVWKHFYYLQDPEYRNDYFRKLSDIGVVGVKVDFMDSESQERLAFYNDCLHDAAKHELMINFHGANKPAGESRTWPNEMAREGIRGLEVKLHSPVHLTALPFTRYLAGHADFTPMHFQRLWMSGTTAPYQVASGIIFSSPVTFFGGFPPDYIESPARPLIEAMPTVWDETIVLDESRIGKLAAYARRAGDDWFVAVMNGGGGRNMKVPLDFLGPGEYEIFAVFDDSRDPMSMKVVSREVGAADTIPVRMRALGGFAAIIRKAAD